MTTRGPRRSSTSSSSTRRTTASTTSTAAGKASTAAANADAAHTTQVEPGGHAVPCLFRTTSTCRRSRRQSDGAAQDDLQRHDHGDAVPEPLRERAVHDRRLLSPTDTTCPPTPLVAFSSPNGFAKGTGSPGGCTRDIVHRFYEEQFQLNGGQQNRYVLQSDAAGLVMGGLRHEGAARSTSTCTSRATRSTRSWTTSSRLRSAARS